MKATFKKDDLAFAVKAVCGFAVPRISLTILGNILIRAEGDKAVFTAYDKAVFTAYDLESHVRCEAPAEIERSGAVTVPARTFSEIVRVLPDADVRVELEGSRVRVSCESLGYDLATLDPDDFPSWPDVKPTTAIELPQKALARILEKTVFAIPSNDPRRVLLGGFFDVDGRALKTVATDGKKLAFVRTEVESLEGEPKAAAIVPRKVLAEVGKTLGDEWSAKILFGGRQVAFDLGQATYVANRIEGAYPSYEQVIPKSFERTVFMPREPLRSLVRQAAVVSDEVTHSVVMRFEDDGLRLSAMTYDVGSYAGSLTVEYDQEPFEIAFNHRFVGEVLGLIDGERVVFKTNTATSPAVFCGEDVDDALFVVMPVRLSKDLGGNAQNAGEEVNGE